MTKVSVDVGAGNWASKSVSAKKPAKFYRSVISLGEVDDANMTEVMTAQVAQVTQWVSHDSVLLLYFVTIVLLHQSS